MSKILITGASGYVGTHLCKVLSKTNHKLFGLYNNSEIKIEGIEKIKIDLINHTELNYIFKDIKPDFVIHLSAVTPANTPNKDEKYLREINVELTNHIAKNAHEYNSFLIFTSTDLVYKEGENIKEDSELHPVNLYAQTKFEAEKIIEIKAKYYLILRLSLLYGFSISEHKTFFDYSFNQLYQRKTVKAFYDQFRNTLFVEDLAYLIDKLLNMKLKPNDVMNMCGWELLSRYDMVNRVSQIFGFDSELILKISCDDFYEYKVPKYLSLNFDKMKEFNFVPRKFDHVIEYLKNNFDIYKPFIFQSNHSGK